MIARYSDHVTAQTVWRFFHNGRKVVAVFNCFSLKIMEDLSQFVQKCNPKEARKKPRSEAEWKRTIERQKR